MGVVRLVNGSGGFHPLWDDCSFYFFVSLSSHPFIQV